MHTQNHSARLDQILPAMSKTFSQSDVASHNKGDNLWIIVDEDVYDLTEFQDEHPGKFVALHRWSGANTSQVARRVSLADRNPVDKDF